MMYWTTILTESSIFAILAMALNVIWGWSGDFDLAVYAYFALGTYTTLIVTVGRPVAPTEYILGWHLPYLLAILLAMFVATAVAALVGAIALRRLREIYFAITTLGAVSALYLSIENYTPLFNGFNGVYGLVNPMNSVLNLSYDGYRYFLLGFCVAILAVVYIVVQRLAGSPFGRMLRSVREDENAAAVYGRSIFSAKYRAYLLGGALAGLAGALFAGYLGTFNPSAWSPTEILVLYAAVLVGGRGNPRGVIVGVFIVYIGFVEMSRYIPSPASRPEFGPAVRQVLIGLLIILMLRLRPAGVVPERLGLDGVRIRRFFARVSPRSTTTDAATDETAGARLDVPTTSAAEADPEGVPG